MINSELRQYAEGLISNYGKEYPYYFMHTNTLTNQGSYSNQYGCTIYMSKTEPTVLTNYSMYSDEWLVLIVYSSNASYNDYSSRFSVSSTSGRVSCNEWEYVYSNVPSTYAYSSVESFPTYPLYTEQAYFKLTGVILCAILLAIGISIWVRR